MRAAEKITDLRELQAVCSRHRQEGRRVVFTNGCFDLLHLGHVRYLEEARSLGDVLVVGVNTDRSVSEIKGPRRPVTGQAERSEVLAALQCVDHVVLFDTPDPLPVIVALEPDVLVKGADWAEGRIVGADFVTAKGGRVVRIPLIPNASTTSIIDRIIERFGMGRTLSEV
ncbi:MAG TPA: D-glycero-beta-D-manno-heptose 1-phosphate adenylyltransferase [Syntrophobacter fumaroxidans]|nr:D-glycero-beta-D-manno-heptose 1-phosphate adenylyltransferase [Syntrophobacter fumaroxidans]